MLASDNKQPDEPGSVKNTARRRVLSVIFFGVGVVLLASAVYTVFTRRATLEDAWDAARGASPLLIAGCLLLPLLNWLSAAGTIWVLTGRFGRVGFKEMSALIGAAWLLNLLPRRPGMVGRVAYHRRYNNIRVRDSMRVLVAAMLCTGCALSLLLMCVVFAAQLPTGGGGQGWRGWGILLVLVVPPAAMAVAALALRQRGHVWRWPAAIACRYIDMATWAVRYALVFALIGRPVGILGAGALTAVSQVAMLTPVQLGLREWAIGLASTALPDSGVAVNHAPIADAAAPGLLADCVMRAAELLIVLPVGLTASVWLWRRTRSAQGGEKPSAPAKSGMTEAEQPG
jgi:hypothetical protein